MSYAVKAWLVFLIGLAAELRADFILRLRDGDVTTGGIPDILGLAIHVGLGTVAVLLAWRGTRCLPAVWQRLAVVSLQVMVGLAVYAVTLLWYVVGTGIDSL